MGKEEKGRPRQGQSLGAGPGSWQAWQEQKPCAGTGARAYLGLGSCPHSAVANTEAQFLW